MKLNKQILKQIIREALQEEDAADPTKLTTTTMGTSQFAKAGLETRKDASQELSGQEKGIINQVDEFLLGLAVQPGVDLMGQRATIQRVMKILQDKLGEKG